MKTCSKCKEDKPYSEYYKNKNCKDGYRGVCKSCCYEVQKEYRKNNQDKVRAYDTEYRLKNKERLSEYYKTWYDQNIEHLSEYWKDYRSKNVKRIQDHKKRYKHRKRANAEYWPNNGWLWLLNFYPNECMKCGSKDGLQLDHVVPISLGGEHSLRNAQILCGTCNSSKGNRNSNDYRPTVRLVDAHG